MQKISQEGGEGSVNYQAGQSITIHNGLSIAEVVELFNALFEQNALRLTADARRVAEERVNEITEELVSRLKRSSDLIVSLQDPDVQEAIFIAQRAYARSGDSNLRETLLALLIERCAEDRTPLEKIVLVEAIETARKLTAQQVDTLTIIWLISRVRTLSIRTFRHILEWADTNLSPFTETASTRDVDLDHIQYCGCAHGHSGFLGKPPMGTVLVHGYPGLFQDGLVGNAIPSDVADAPYGLPLFTPCFHDPAKIQVNAVTREDARTLIGQINPEVAEKYVQLLDTGIMSADRAVEKLGAANGNWSKLNSLWRDGNLGNFDLTPVGIAIAHSNWVRRTNNPAPLSEWL